jgi:hypothetical protein
LEVPILSVSPTNTLAQVATASAQTTAQYELKLIGAQMTAQLNRKLSKLKAQANDPTLPALQRQVAALNHKKTSYESAQGQLSGNGTITADISTQIATMGTAAGAGDSATFDQALAQIATDLSILSVVQPLPGLQPDNAANLKVNGLGIQSSAAYGLTTAAGKTQAIADLAAAKAIVDQLAATTTQNLLVSAGIGDALNDQVASINNRISSKQQAETTAALAQVHKLQTQTKTQFHLIELAFGNVGQTNTLLQSVAIAESNRAATAGSIFAMFNQQGGTSAPAPVSNIISTLA